METLRRTIANMFRIPELRRRLLITIALLGVFRFGCAIPIPGIDIGALDALMGNLEESAGGRLFGFMMLLSGGAAQRMSIFALGIMPYITSAIIFQMLTKAVPSLKQLQEEGPTGRRKIKQYTRLCAIPICVFQGLMIAMYLYSRVELVPGDIPQILFYVTSTVILTGGGIFIMWLGEQITEHGIGNGASILIMAGILAALGPVVLQLSETAWEGGGVAPIQLFVLLILFILVVSAITYINMSQRRIPVQHGKHVRGRRMYGGQKNYLPLKVNQAGVMPVIFAQSLTMFPLLIGQNLPDSWLITDFFINVGGGETGAMPFLYVITYIGLVYFFTYFWTALMFQPVDMADQLKESGSFIPGVRPGKRTARFLENIMNRITLAGGAFLAVIALMPDLIAFSMGIRQVGQFLGGTGILIIVQVTMDTVDRIESQMMMREYEGFFKEAGKKGKGRGGP